MLLISEEEKSCAPRAPFSLPFDPLGRDGCESGARFSFERYGDLRILRVHHVASTQAEVFEPLP